MIFDLLVYTVILLLAVPTLVFFTECVAALLPLRPGVQKANRQTRRRTAVLIPAHNEASGITDTLHALLPQMDQYDRIVVVADNCQDATALVARQAGVEVLERTDSVRRGKGFALDFGLQYLKKNPPDVVVIVDADCHVHAGALQRIAQLAVETQRPVQALYLMEQPAQPQPKDAVSALAFLVKNLVRPTGLKRFGAPCLLTGTGMAFPWHVLHKAKLASGNIVEDMQLGLDLALLGHPPLFCGEARVTGRLPQHASGAASQRTRWEHGHLQTLFAQAPRLLRAAISQRRCDLAALAAELCVPPLALLVLMWIAITGASTIGTIFRAQTSWSSELHWQPALMCLSGLSLVVLPVLGAWIKFARAVLPITSLLAAPIYVIWKLPIYAAFLLKRQKAWVRTQRDTE